MNKKDFLNALKILREKTKKRNFTQTADLIIAFKNLDIKKPEATLNIQLRMPHATGKSASTKLLFARSTSFMEEVKDLFDKIIPEEKIPDLNKKELNEVVNNYDILYAEAPTMIPVAKHLGQQLGPKGKMPTPVQATRKNVEDILKQSSAITRLTNRKSRVNPYIAIIIGKETDSDENLSENAITVFDAVQNALPIKSQNIKTTYLKFTMSEPVKVGEKQGDKE